MILAPIPPGRLSPAARLREHQQQRPGWVWGSDSANPPVCAGSRKNQERVTCPRAHGHPPPSWSHACEVPASWHGWGSSQAGQRTELPVPTSGRPVTKGLPKTQGWGTRRRLRAGSRLARPQRAGWILERSSAEPISHVRSRGWIPGCPRPATQLQAVSPTLAGGPRYPISGTPAPHAAASRDRPPSDADSSTPCRWPWAQLPHL